jgi:hypothetical protein
MIADWIGRVFAGHASGNGAGSNLEKAARMNEAGVVSSLTDTTDRMTAELDRARRYERALSVAVLSTIPLLEVNGHGPGANGNRAHGAVLETRLPQVLSLLAAGVLTDIVRGSDVVCYRPSEDLFVLALAESDIEAAKRALFRIGDLFKGRLNLGFRAGLARFPEDGLTLDDLVAKASARMSPDFARRAVTRLPAASQSSTDLSA